MYQMYTCVSVIVRYIYMDEIYGYEICGYDVSAVSIGHKNIRYWLLSDYFASTTARL